MIDPDFSNRLPTTTDDGSSTFRIAGTQEHFHSIHGALGESTHIYIRAGLQQLDPKEEIHILEMGFGTGLNALLTLIHQGDRKVTYHAIEAYPLRQDEVRALNYAAGTGNRWREALEKMHEAKDQEKVMIAPGFLFQKNLRKLEETDLPGDYYHLVYFDAFSPDLQPELWSTWIFQKIAAAMKAGGLLLTYCAKGQVKRNMKAAGFAVESLPGPAGKREISRAVKKYMAAP